MSDRAVFEARKIIKDKEGHCIMIKGSILQEGITMLNMYVPNNRTSKYVRQKLIELQREIDKSTIIVEYFSTPHQKSSRQKISKDTVELNTTTNQLDITDIYRLFHPTTAKYIFFSSSHGSFTKINHILGYKIYINTLKSIEII